MKQGSAKIARSAAGPRPLRDQSSQESTPDRILASKATLERRLRRWFENHARDLPWRRTRDPYCIWVSEVMLQQTQVATVVGYYERFLARFPNVQALAAATEEDVLRIWEGLGYYRRARQLYAAARVIVERHGGEFPRRVEEVRALPGIGRYTAGAVLSLAHDEPLAILEANTIRLLSRLVAYRGVPASGAGQRFLWHLAEALVPRHEAGQFNQALMELGSQICTPRAPACEDCPLRRLCQAFALGLQEEIPRPVQKVRYENVREAAVVVWRGPRVLLRRCLPGERWAGLWDFPRFAISGARGKALRKELASKVWELTGATVATGARLATVRHGVTRYRITLECHEAEWQGASRAKQSPELRWATLAQLSEMPLSVTGRKLATLLAEAE